ncbi:MAG: DNA alkylation repair protein [Bacteroidota bacterium]
MHEHLLNRKGPRKPAETDPEVLQLLNQGELETVNLSEWLAVNQVQLIKHCFPAIGLEAVIPDCVASIAALKKASAMNMIKAVGEQVFRYAAAEEKTEEVFEKLAHHLSDTVRCYACYLKGLDGQLRLQEKLDQSKKLIADHHFGVREVVWMALRPVIDAELDEAIQILSRWTSDPDENVRRFITESTRPRGVWCKHIDRLKETPGIALPLLHPLRHDPSVYVQNSLGNWLNDASKTQPEFVIDLCNQWQSEASKATLKIIKRARRTIDKG